MQLMELDVPMVLALNMMDEVRENGGAILINEMEAFLGIPVVPISAAKNEGIEDLVSHALHVAKYQERPGRQDFCDANDKGGAVHRCLHGIMHLIEDHAGEAGIPVRFAATKLAEGDKLVMDQLHLDENEREMLEHIIRQMEQESSLDRAAAIAGLIAPIFRPLGFGNWRVSTALITGFMAKESVVSTLSVCPVRSDGAAACAHHTAGCGKPACILPAVYPPASRLSPRLSGSLDGNGLSASSSNNVSSHGWQRFSFA